MGIHPNVIRAKTLELGPIMLTIWCDVDLTFDFASVTLPFKIFSSLYLGNKKKCRKLKLARETNWGYMSAICWCNFDLTFYLAKVTFTLKKRVCVMFLKLQGLSNCYFVGIYGVGVQSHGVTLI